MGFLDGSDSKESACNAGDMGSFPGSERSPGEGNGHPLQYSCLGNPTHRGARQMFMCVLVYIHICGRVKVFLGLIEGFNIKK